MVITGGVVSTSMVTTTAAEVVEEPNRLLPPPTVNAPPLAERAMEEEEVVEPRDDEAAVDMEKAEVAPPPREERREDSLAATAPQFPFTLHLSVPVHVCSDGAQGSTTVMERVTTADRKLKGPVAVYETTQGTAVVLLLKFDGMLLTNTTGITPEAESEAYAPAGDNSFVRGL